MSRNRRNSLVSAVRHGTAVSLLVIGRAVLVEILRARRNGLIGRHVTRRSIRLVALLNGVALRLLRDPAPRIDELKGSRHVPRT
jgi:hypothetical protein